MGIVINMQWEIVDAPVMPKCVFCGKWTQKMARFNNPEAGEFKYICHTCAKYVRTAMNKWDELSIPDLDYIERIGNAFCSDDIDKAIGNTLEHTETVIHGRNDKCDRLDAHDVSECSDVPGGRLGVVPKMIPVGDNNDEDYNTNRKYNNID